MNRIRERGIGYEDIKQVILSGEIIEEYPEDYPHPSCLVFGVLANKKVLHTVMGISDNRLWIITAYYPSLDKWNTDYKTRKERT